jgi:hypothetical protein
VKKRKFCIRFNHLHFGILLILGLIVYPLLNTPIAAAAADQISITPSAQSVNKGSLLTINVHEDSGTDAINGVQANLTYSTSQFKLVSVSAAAGWSVAQSNTSTPGLILFAAFPSPSGSTLTGDYVIETVVLQAYGSGIASLGFGCNLDISTCPTGNAITRASDNTNILFATVGSSIVINTSSLAAAQSGGSSRLLARLNGTLIAKDGLNDPWATEATAISTPTEVFAAGDRIGYLDSNKSLYVKQGLSGVWLKESNSVDDAMLTPKRIVVRIGTTILAKDGLNDPWATEATGITTPAIVFAAGDRIGYLDSNKNLYVKQGLSGAWLKESNGADDVILTSSRITVRSGSTILAKDGLSDPWTIEVTGLSLPAHIFAAGDRIGYLDSGSSLIVKQGLNGVWAKVATSVDDAVLTPNRIVARLGGTLLAKDGLNDPWATEATGIGAPAQIFASGDRIGYSDSGKSLYVKQGLSGAWLKESTGVDDAVILG